MIKVHLSAGRRNGRGLGAAVVVAALVLVGAGASVSPVARAQGRGDAKVMDAILGVRIGSHLDEVHDKLKRLGTFGGRGTRNGGRREAWTLKKTEFTSVAYQTDKDGKIIWVTGFLRPGRAIPFDKLGDPAHATVRSDAQTRWNVQTPEGGYRLVAKGGGGRANVVYLFSLATPPPQ